MENHRPLTEKISEAIKTQKIKMKPKAYFIIGSTLMAIGIAAAIAVTIFFVSLASFRLRVHGPFSYLRSGFSGVPAFIENFPWVAILLSLVGIIGGLIILRHYEISYKKAFLGVAIGFVAVLLVVAIFVDEIGIHNSIWNRSLIKPLYQHPFIGDSWVAGQVILKEDSQLIIQTPRGERLVVSLEEISSKEVKNIIKGEWLRLLGDWDDEIFIAESIWEAPVIQNAPIPNNCNNKHCPPPGKTLNPPIFLPQ